MARYNIYNKRLVALFLLGAALFSYPLLALFNRPLTAGGFPLLYGYIFSVWIGLIVGIRLVVRSRIRSVRRHRRL